MGSLWMAAFGVDQAVVLAEVVSGHWIVNCSTEVFEALTCPTAEKDPLQQGFAEQNQERNACNLAVWSYLRKNFAACSSTGLSLGQVEPGDPSCTYHHQTKALSSLKDYLNQRIPHLQKEKSKVVRCPSTKIPNSKCHEVFKGLFLDGSHGGIKQRQEKNREASKGLKTSFSMFCAMSHTMDHRKYTI